MSQKPLSLPDPEAFMAEVMKAWVPAGYTPEQRQADFRAVLFGTQQGKRVLYQILAWAHLWQPSFRPGDPTVTAFAEGERNMGIKIFMALNATPKQRPAKATSVKPKEASNG